MKEYIFKSMVDGKVVISINEGVLKISRPGIAARLLHGSSGDRVIMINQIAAIQLKRAGLSQGYIKIILNSGISKQKGPLGAKIDENVILFDAGTHNRMNNQNAEEIKEYIENYIQKLENKNTTEDDKYDKLLKLKKLLDSNAISIQEYETEKSKILSK